MKFEYVTSFFPKRKALQMSNPNKPKTGGPISKLDIPLEFEEKMILFLKASSSENASEINFVKNSRHFLLSSMN